MVGHRCSFQTTIVCANNVWCRCGQSRLPSKRLERSGHCSLVRAWISNDRKMLYVCNAVRRSDCMGIHFDKILSIAKARPTAVVHVTLHVFSCDGTQCQTVTVELRRVDGRTADGAVTRKQFVQLCGVKVLWKEEKWTNGGLLRFDCRS